MAMVKLVPPMTLEKFYETLDFMAGADQELSIQTGLENIASTLSNLVGSPANAQHQSTLASGIVSFTESIQKLRSELTPTLSGAIAELGGKEFFDPEMAEKVKESIAMNAMTPSVARDFVQALVNRRTQFLTTVKETLKGLKSLKVSASELAPGTADLAFLIPRDLFDNKLGTFAKELNFIDRLVGDFSEALTGEKQAPELEQLSSSIPTVAIMAAVPVIAALADLVNKFLKAWEKIEKIRKIRAELTDMGMKGPATDQLEAQITTTVEEVIEESTKTVFASHNGDGGRRKELENAIRQDTRRLLGQIERGLTIQFRAEPGKTSSEEDAKALEAVNKISKVIEFPAVKHAPMLLSPGEIIEGEIAGTVTTVSKKKTTTTTTRQSGQGKEKKEETA
jgi:hypothetical protein